MSDETERTRMRRDLMAYHRSITEELKSIRNRIRQLIGDTHWLTDGEYKEAILRRVLRNHLPESVRVGTGFVCYQDGSTSNQIDILLTDTSKPTLLKDQDLVIVIRSCGQSYQIRHPSIRRCAATQGAGRLHD